MKFLSTLLLLFTFLTASAVPTNPRPFMVTQKDGTLLQLRFIGDESFSYYATDDGVPLIKIADSYYYASIDEVGQLKSFGMLAHEPAMRTAQEEQLVGRYATAVQKDIRRVWSQRVTKRNEMLEEATNARKVRQKALGRPTTYKGKKKGIVILVNYADLQMKSTSTREAWDDQFNKHGYSKNNHMGSVRDYFLDQSYGQLEIDFDVVGPYTVSQGWRYYGQQRDGGSSDIHPCQLVSEACKLANKDVNFKDYDWNGNGEVDQVFVVYAGYSAASGYDEDAIWPHEWHLAYGSYYGDGNGAITLDGVKIDNYALSSELLGRSGSTMDAIGTAVHEFSHCLGLPDFYDVDGNGTQCMDYWDVLDAGCYSGPNWRGEVPTGYTAYERNFAGWLKYTELTEPCKVNKLENLGDTAQAYIYYNKGNKNEYFIMENRQAKGWFKYPGSHGMLVYHVDYDKGLWEGDRPNSDPAHPRMTFVPADKNFNRSTVAGMNGDFFPGANTVRTLSNTSHVNCYGKMFNKNIDGTYNTYLELTQIRETGGNIAFTFNGGETAVKKELTTLIEHLNHLLDTPHVDLSEGASTRLDDAIFEAEEIAEQSLTSQKYRTAIDNLLKQGIKFLFEANPTDTLQPFDITFTINNASISSNQGWKEEVDNNAFVYANNCGEYTNMKFTLSQTITPKLPKGLYTASVQAFQRTGAKITAGANNGIVNAYFFARTHNQKVHSITDDAQTTKLNTNDINIASGEDSGGASAGASGEVLALYIPANAKSASTYFKAGLYENRIDFENTLESGTSVKLGLKCSMPKADYWTCFTNFRLLFHGDSTKTVETAIIAISDNSTVQVHSYNSTHSPHSTIIDLQGRKVTHPRQGLYIINNRKVLIK